VLRFIEERKVESTAALIGVAGDVAYVVNSREAIAFWLAEGKLVEKFRVAVPSTVHPVRVAAREGHAYVLDEKGHWSLIAETGITQTRSFDPETEGRVAVFGRHRFDIEDEELTYRFDEGEAHRAPLLAKDAGLWRIGSDRLLLYRSHRWGSRDFDLFLFQVGETPVRLTKVCGAISGELTEPAHVTVGEVDLDTDREGGFEIWSAQWGFFSPSVDASAVCPKKESDCYLHDRAGIDPDVWLFRRPVLEVDGDASCEEICGE
jgi:hypothetical protein